MTQSLAVEWGPRGIRCNAIAPGPIDTPMVEGITEDWKAAKRAELPLGRFGVPEEVAPSAVLLGADGQLAGGPVNGGSAVIEFVQEIREQLAEAQSSDPAPRSR